MSRALEEFTELMRKTSKNNIPIQTEWCIVKEVDWEEKTMTATSNLNNLDYFDVLLGLGSIYKHPKIGALALVGFIANTKACFMIDCEAFDQMVVVSKDSKFVIKQEGFIVLQEQESLKVVMNDLIQSINNQNQKMQDLCIELQKVIVVNGTTPNVPALQEINNSLVSILEGNNAINDRLNTILIE